MREPYIGNPQSRIPTTRRDDMLDIGPVREHIRSLQSIGMTASMIERAAGLATYAVPRLMGQQMTVRRVVADAVLAVDGRATHQQAIVLNVGCRRRLEGLSVFGYSSRVLAKELGVDKSRIYYLRTQLRVSWSQHQSVAEMFDRLGPDGGSDRARKYAARQGWVHPMMWDDIDDPAEVPVSPADSGSPDPVVVDRLVSGRPTDATREERRLAFFRLRESGLTITAAAELAGIESRTAHRYLTSSKGIAA